LGKYGHTFWKISGDALRTDTDGDGASDYIETVLFGTDPLVGAMDLAPELIAQKSVTIHTDNIHLKTYAKMGGMFGETGIKDGSMNWLVGDPVASSIPYFCGWMASGYFVAGDIRDISETLYQGDGVGTALNAVAFAPAVGDAEKTGNTLRKLATKYPSKISDTGRYLCSVLPGNTPNEVFEVVHDTGFLGRERLAIGELHDAGKSVPEINAEISVGEKWLIKSANAIRISHFNDIPGNLNKYSASKGKTVLGTFEQYLGSPRYTEVLPKEKANFLNIDKTITPWSWEKNKELLDCAIDNGDEIILSVDYRILPDGLGETFKQEIRYLEENGYRISQSVGEDGLYRMVKA